MYAAKIIADSSSPNNERLTTFEVVIPRSVLAELNTHKMISKNSASSRAMPVEKLIKMATETPYIPERFGVNQRGMQSEEYLEGEDAEAARVEWLQARDYAVLQSRNLLKLNVHKQFVNRLLEPFLWHTCILTGTDWSNFFNLRCHPAAHPAIRTTADLMVVAHATSRPRDIGYSEWHTPYVNTKDDASWLDPLRGTAKFWGLAARVSSGRCARISYLTHDGKRDHNKDLELYGKLVGPGHMSPLEHPARPLSEAERDTFRMHHYVLENGHAFSDRNKLLVGYKCRNSVVKTRRTTHYCGNLDGFMQHRKTIPYEHDVLGSK